MNGGILYVVKSPGQNPTLHTIRVKPWGGHKIQAADAEDIRFFERLFYRTRINTPKGEAGVGRTIGTFYGFDKDALLATVAEELEDVVAQCERRLIEARESRDNYAKWLEEQVDDA